MKRPRLHTLALWVAVTTTLASAQAAAQAPPPPPVAPQAPPPPPPYYPPPAQPPYGYSPYPYPPPYYYPPPVYPPPVVAPAPAPAPPQPPIVVYNWDPDAPVPDGYELVGEANGRLIWAGVGLLSAGWLTATLIGSGASAAEDDDDADDADGVTADDWAPLYFPVVGPFVALGTLDPKPSEMGLLIANGVLQVGGALGIIAGAFDQRHKLVRSYAGQVRLTPLAGPGLGGLSAVGRF